MILMHKYNIRTTCRQFTVNWLEQPNELRLIDTRLFLAGLKRINTPFTWHIIALVYVHEPTCIQPLYNLLTRPFTQMRSDYDY